MVQMENDVTPQIGLVMLMAGRQEFHTLSSRSPKRLRPRMSLVDAALSAARLGPAADDDGVAFIVGCVPL